MYFLFFLWLLRHRMNWLQNYDPLGNAFLSTLVAVLPVVVLLGSIAILKIRVHFSALLGLAVALAILAALMGLLVFLQAVAWPFTLMVVR